MILEDEAPADGTGGRYVVGVRGGEPTQAQDSAEEPNGKDLPRGERGLQEARLFVRAVHVLHLVTRVGLYSGLSLERTRCLLRLAARAVERGA